MALGGIRFLVLLADGLDESSIRSALPLAAPLWVMNLHDEGGRADAIADELDADVVVVGCTTPSEPALATIRLLAAAGKDRPVVVLYEGNPNGFIHPAFEAGADDLITLPLAPTQLAFALEKVIARRRNPGGSAAVGRMITILGPKGGTGKTLVSCNLAVALAARGGRPVVVDLDLQFGDVGLALGLSPTQTIYDLALAGDTLDAGKVDSFVVTHPTGVRALLSPVRPDQAAVVTIGFLRKLFEILLARYEFVIVDTPPSFSPEVIAAIDRASDLCVVGMLDALSLKDTKIGFETLQQMGYDADHIMLILNRADSSVGITQDDVRRILGKIPDILVPSDRAIPRAITGGQTILEAEPRSGAAQAFAELAGRYLDRGTTQNMTIPDAPRPAIEEPRRRAILRRGN